ncbi:hypothetical protein [Micromonospora echinofusca]|uniref:Peptidase inhibitor family I36 n=1 Tax=Micromonospora echinofusca TaxID=47858 RepID=A0ABS3VQW1_MICEH|nr:hypothetical protein [Micromonospora echinofusca]MBO4206895.1 hypothetical protein [Micromonospora echinofusca]
MSIRKALTPAALAAVVLTGILVNAPAAQASGGVCNPGCTSHVEFASYGEILTVHDYAANGRSTVALLDINRDGSYSQYWNGLGYDAPPAEFNLEIGEGVAIRYKACEGYLSTGEIFNCSGWYNDVA